MTTYEDVKVKFPGEPAQEAERAVLRRNGWLCVTYDNHRAVYPPHLAPQLLVRHEAETETDDRREVVPA